MFCLKRFFTIVIAVALAAPVVAQAHLISITATTPFPSSVYTSTSHTATYTVTNISTNPLTGIEDQSTGHLPAGVSITSSTCGPTTPLNPGSSCTIQLQLTAPSSATTLTGSLREHPLPSADGVYSTIGPISVLTGSAVRLTAVGSSGSVAYSSAPLLLQSVDLGTTWTDPTILGLPTMGEFYNTSCSGSGSNALCIAAGMDYITGYPLLAQSVDGGTTWTQPTIPGTVSPSLFYSGSCKGSGASAMCVAAGGQVGGALLAQSLNGGSTWTLPSISGLPTADTYIFYSVSCSGTGSTGVCVAVGRSVSDDVGSPLLIQTSDGGATWTTPNLSAILPAEGAFISASCVNSGASALCTVAGEDKSNDTPLLIQSLNGGTTWTRPSISGLPDVGSFSGTSCAGSGASILCTAVGQYFSNDTLLPYLAQTTNSGSSWSSVSIPGVTTEGEFKSVSCTGSDAEIVCVAAGNITTPLLAQTTNSGSSWSATTTGIPASSVLASTSCTGSGSNTVCTVSGATTEPEMPLLLVQVGNSSAWSTVSNASTASAGRFYSTSATGL